MPVLTANYGGLGSVISFPQRGPVTGTDYGASAENGFCCILSLKENKSIMMTNLVCFFFICRRGREEARPYSSPSEVIRHAGAIQIRLLLLLLLLLWLYASWVHPKATLSLKYTRSVPCRPVHICFILSSYISEQHKVTNAELLENENSVA